MILSNDTYFLDFAKQYVLYFFVSVMQRIRRDMYPSKTVLCGCVINAQTEKNYG